MEQARAFGRVLALYDQHLPSHVLTDPSLPLMVFEAIRIQAAYTLLQPQSEGQKETIVTQAEALCKHVRRSERFFWHSGFMIKAISDFLSRQSMSTTLDPAAAGPAANTAVPVWMRDALLLPSDDSQQTAPDANVIQTPVNSVIMPAGTSSQNAFTGGFVWDSMTSAGFSVTNPYCNMSGLATGGGDIMLDAGHIDLVDALFPETWAERDPAAWSHLPSGGSKPETQPSTVTLAEGGKPLRPFRGSEASSCTVAIRHSGKSFGRFRPRDVRRIVRVHWDRPVPSTQRDEPTEPTVQEGGSGALGKKPGEVMLGVPSRQFDNVTVFKGIPYAASTAGENRWRPPSQPAHWVEPRLCDTFGPACPQIGPAQLANMSEDCLSLNVWTPAASPHDHKLPVYVWIYGGRFIFGAASEPTFDGAYLASQGIVVVTINYRLGVFGFLAHPELSAESAHGASGNYGLLDQLCALQWVRDNIAKFGGDPLNVTLGGQSAGSASVGIHLYSPLSRGLFHRTIVESGMRHPQDPLISALAPSYLTKEKAETQGQAYVAEKGVKTIVQLREVPVEHLLIGNNRNDETMWGNPPFFRPCVDGYIFPRSYSSTLAGGYQADVPVLTGHNRDEGGTYSDPRFDRDDCIECTKAKFGPLLPRFNQLYPCGADQDPREVWNTAARDNSRITIDLWAQEFAKHCTSTVV
ncbi:hypothetical protein EHS25_007127 [Saitozyma podzolica]|uniref:Carboxylic ester hydrolase n=1 Tax=Saitozyma podzolica TaxID=1890683 RepID=A0A427XP86_9TREE|nr:hypothetical protein EHS25_007127 [Saitozyma podzolica]